MKERKGSIPLFLTGLILLLAACSPQPVELETASPPPTPPPEETTPSPTPIPISTETNPPAWTGQAVDFTGEWHRTEVYIARPSTIEITDQTETGFTFSLEAYYYSHVGTAGGSAYFTSKSTAFWRNDDSFDDIATGCLFFTMEDGSLKIEEEGQLPFGMNVSACGTYTTGEPVYFTNGILEALGPERLTLLKETVGEDYEELVGLPLSQGSFELSEISEGGYSGLFLDGWLPTMGYQQKIYIGDDGAVWANFQSGQYFTNRPQAKLPGFLLFSENS